VTSFIVVSTYPSIVDLDFSSGFVFGIVDSGFWVLGFGFWVFGSCAWPHLSQFKWSLGRALNHCKVLHTYMNTGPLSRSLSFLLSMYWWVSVCVGLPWCLYLFVCCWLWFGFWPGLLSPSNQAHKHNCLCVAMCVCVPGSSLAVLVSICVAV